MYIGGIHVVAMIYIRQIYTSDHLFSLISKYTTIQWRQKVGARGDRAPPNFQITGAEFLQQLPCVTSRVYHKIEYRCSFQTGNTISYSGRIHCTYVVPKRFQYFCKKCHQIQFHSTYFSIFFLGEHVPRPP